jgi:hypothetical protein
VNTTTIYLSSEQHKGRGIRVEESGESVCLAPGCPGYLYRRQSSDVCGARPCAHGPALAEDGTTPDSVSQRHDEPHRLKRRSPLKGSAGARRSGLVPAARDRGGRTLKTAGRRTRTRVRASRSASGHGTRRMVADCLAGSKSCKPRDQCTMSSSGRMDRRLTKRTIIHLRRFQ